MADNTIHSLTSTLTTQSLVEAAQLSQPGPIGDGHPQNPGELPNPPPIPPMGGPGLQEGGPETPVKRRPGRPKGSGKKPLDPNAPPKIKRPVGRPRKDGLPAGSVGPRRASRPRKRPPGTFASGGPSSAVFPYGGPYSYGPGEPPQWPASISAPPMGSLPRNSRPPQVAFPIDPSLDRDNWAELVRNRPDVFLHSLVSALYSPNPVSGAGPSVEEAFKSHLVSLAPNSKNTPSIPSLYSILKTFWLPSSPVYFSLTASASTARTPSEHRFLYWDPQPLVFNGIACPSCSAPLINRGRISTGPIKVYDLGKPFFVIGCEYVCKSPACVSPAIPDGRKFASTDASILRALPAKLRDEFPAHLLTGNPDMGSGPDVWSWRGMGVSIALWNMVRACLRAGLRKEPILDIIKSIQGGASEYDLAKREEEEGEQDEELDENESNQDAEQVEGDLEDPKDVSAAAASVIQSALTSLQKSAEEYQEAWNANSGVAEASGVPEAGPSNVADANGNAPQQATASADPALAQRTPAPPPPQYPYGQPAYPPYPYAYPYFHPAPQHPDMNPQNGGPSTLKRTFAIVDGSPDSSMSEPMQKRIRHCCKCGSNECKGKGGRAFCTNPCQDCGKLDCKGRNSKRPDRTCADAWP